MKLDQAPLAAIKWNTRTKHQFNGQEQAKSASSGDAPHEKLLLQLREARAEWEQRNRLAADS